MARRSVMERVADGLAGGLVAAVVSGAPSTLHALWTRRPLLDSTRAAGSLVYRDDASARNLLVTGVAVHLALSLGWGALVGATLPARRTTIVGVLWGAGIAFVDLGLVGRSNSRIAALPAAPQVADHVAFGVVVAAVVTRRRSWNARTVR